MHRQGNAEMSVPTGLEAMSCSSTGFWDVLVLEPHLRRGRCLLKLGSEHVARPESLAGEGRDGRWRRGETKKVSIYRAWGPWGPSQDLLSCSRGAQPERGALGSRRLALHAFLPFRRARCRSRAAVSTAAVRPTRLGREMKRERYSDVAAALSA